MDRLIEVADELAQLRQTRAQTSLLQWQANQDLEARLTEITPADGWPGKNAEQRDAAKAKALAADDQYQAAQIQANTAYKALAELDARIAGLEDERRALEWGIRLRQVAALEARPQGDRRSDDGKLFDEHLQFTAEEQAWAENGQALSLAPEPEEIPF